MPLYPGTGAASERGIGNIVNAPLRPMSGSEEFRKAFSTIIIPALEAFRPELVIISAGFDAHRDDPLAQLMLLEADYAWSTERLAAIAKKHAQGRIVSSLEGGYNLRALAGSAAAHVAALLAA
jgi:acetoin utilization deacetylase AcuC-like enzyme